MRTIRTSREVGHKNRQEIIDHLQHAINKARSLTPGCPIAMDLYTLKALQVALQEADEYIKELELPLSGQISGYYRQEVNCEHLVEPKLSLLDNKNPYYKNYYSSTITDSEVIKGVFEGSFLNGFLADEWVQGFDNNWWVEIYALPYTEDESPLLPPKAANLSGDYPPLWGMSETPWVLGPNPIQDTLGNKP